MNKNRGKQFVECENCRVKPGSPQLCNDCLSRRDAFYKEVSIFIFAKDKLQEYWHSFKIWFCKEEVDFFQKEIKRYQEGVPKRIAELEDEVKMYKAYFHRDSAEIKRLNDEKASMLFLDPAKVIKTEEVIIDLNGKPALKKVLKINNEPLSGEMTRVLREEAQYIKRTQLWSIFQNTIVNTAKLAMFENSKDYNDMISGKSLLYALDLLKKITDRILE